MISSLRDHPEEDALCHVAHIESKRHMACISHGLDLPSTYVK